MTAEARTVAQVFQELQLALTDADLRLPEMMITDTADGTIRVNLGSVRLSTAGKLSRVLRADRS